MKRSDTHRKYNYHQIYSSLTRLRHRSQALNAMNNANKRITGISEDVWNYRIGGYQVLDKWFKSRKDEVLTIDGFEHIANIAGILAETIKVQEDLKNTSKK